MGYDSFYLCQMRCHNRHSGLDIIEQFVWQTEAVIQICVLVEGKAKLCQLCYRHHFRIWHTWEKFHTVIPMIGRDFLFKNRQNISSTDYNQLTIIKILHRINKFFRATLNVNSRALQNEYMFFRIESDFLTRSWRRQHFPHRDIADDMHFDAIFFMKKICNGLTNRYHFRQFWHNIFLNALPNTLNLRTIHQFRHFSEIFMTVVYQRDTF